MEKLFSQIEKYILFAIVLLLPLLVIPISPNPFVVPKLALLVYGVAILLFIRAVRVITEGKLSFSVGTYDFPVFIFAAAFIASALLRSPNKMEAFLLPGTATAVAAGAFIYYFVNQLKGSDKKILTMVLFGSGIIFTVISLLSFSGLMAKIPQLPSYIKTQGFTPEGGHLPAAIFLATLLPLGVGLLLSEKDKTKKLLLAAGALVLVFGLGVSIYNILPGRPFSPRFPSMATSWSIAVDSLKNSPVLGVGPGNYLTAFNRFRPLSYNQSDLWAIKFATANSFYLTVLTEVGLLGFAGLMLLLFNAYKTIRKDLKEQKLVNWGFAANANIVALVLLLIATAIFPATVLITVLLFVYLALNSKAKSTTLNLTAQGSDPAQGLSTQQIATRFPALLISLPVIVVIGLVVIRASVILAAEYKFKKALDSLAANDAAKTYDTIREAIRLNPYVDRYRATNSRINLALANAIAQRATGPERAQQAEGQPQASPSAQITQEERNNITLLIQQAISEGKSTVALNPLRAGNWEVLAQIYRAIMPLAQGADAFSVQTYRQAVALDPFNPNLRIALGGIHYALKDYDNAVRIFESATAAKNDHANAHFNLAFALRESGNLDRAIQELSLVLSLITDKESNDYQITKKALEDMQAKKKAQAPAGEELNPPQPAEKPVLEPPVNLPEGSEPPEAPLPSPTPEASPSPSVTGTGSPSPTPLP